ncbi:unnamed protein product, partial [marine sediment metagenome]
QRHQGTAYAENIFKHLKEEVRELGEGLRNDNFDNAIEEIAFWQSLKLFYFQD